MQDEEEENKSNKSRDGSKPRRSYKRFTGNRAVSKAVEDAAAVDLNKNDEKSSELDHTSNDQSTSQE